MRSTRLLNGMLGMRSLASQVQQSTLVPWSWSKKDFCFYMENARLESLPVDQDNASRRLLTFQARVTCGGQLVQVHDS